ncbi:nucleotidyltransferase domain-containing protein [uncultured Thiohalocapsa sp.]|uniref:nucleotidyltransferase domain-containing protein n=1 Tax=uncultured Thiohalocapsa sp. TaxID=768990 RepID=UPI0025E3A143|nr:nucleotidyltransferase domain-containing protein [uncultured Thiohalocapsa sp.]
MRLTAEQIQAILDSVHDIAGSCAKVRVFGSRLQDDARGGDLDLLVELPEAVEHPARLSARLSARISRSMHGRSVDIVLLAPNLRRLPIHDIALREGRLL